MVRQAELIRQAQDGDKKARDKVVSDNLGLVHAIVRRFEKRGHDREELFQIGCIGLIKAIDHFDLSLNLAFSTYAVPMITGEIRRFLRDDGMVKSEQEFKRKWIQNQQGKRSSHNRAGERSESFGAVCHDRTWHRGDRDGIGR